MNSAATDFVKIHDMVFSHGDRTVFDGIDINIERGKITAIMGPSGTGKTTLLKLIGGQLLPDSGSILVNDRAISHLSSKALFNMRKKMGMLFQSAALFTNLSVFENVAFPYREHTKLPETMIHDLVLMKLETVGLRGASTLMPSELSGGMSRRVALARAIALDPEFIMYDEPFTGQDPITLAVIAKLIKNLNKTLGLTSIIVSHDVQETANIADYIYVLAKGKVVGEGTPEAIMKNPTPEVRQFIRGLPDGPVHFHYPSISLTEEFSS